jgi:N-acetylmuramoyl-L-alanine amidase
VGRDTDRHLTAGWIIAAVVAAGAALAFSSPGGVAESATARAGASAGPSGGQVAPAAPPPGDTSSTAVSLYRVRPGDTLTSVAGLHAVTVADLAAANGLDVAGEIQPADRLRIPAGRAAGPPPRPGPAASPEVPASLARWSAVEDLRPELLAAVLWQESRWIADARSSRGAIGVGQLLPGTAAWVGEELLGDRLDPSVVDDNVRLAAGLLAWLTERNDGDHAAALAAYYQGPASVQERGWLDETERYVAQVFHLRWRFAEGLGPAD